MIQIELELAGLFSALDELPVLNLHTVAELRDITPPDEPEFLSELLADFERDTLAQLSAMHMALSQGDAATLEHAAHKLKGMSGTLGAIRLSRLAGVIQERAQRRELLHVSQLLSRLQDEFDSARIALKEAVAD